jgi:lysophospholipase L1-like esterase
MLFLYIKDLLREDAIVSKLPYDAGNTAEILGTIEYWPLEDKNVVHVYTGHRDLMPDETGRPFIDREQFEKNLKQIIEILLTRARGRIVFSNIPPVADSFLRIDPDRNEHISEYNSIIEKVTKSAGITLHDFQGFVVAYPKKDYLYSDGLHFTRKFYRMYAADLAVFLKKYL